MKKRRLCVLHPKKKKKKGTKRWGTIITKSDYSRTEETVIDKTFE